MRLMGKIKTRELTHMGIMIAIAVVASRLNVDNPALGSSSRFGFSFVIFLGGIWFGPVKGGIVGIISNLISFVLFDVATGPFLIGFVVNAFLAGYIPGLFFLLVRKYKVGFNFMAPSVVLLVLTSILSIWYASEAGYYSELTKQLIIAALILIDILMVVLYFVGNRKGPVRSGAYVTFDKILFVSIIYKFINTVVLAPLWLSMLFGYSYRYYLLIRFVKYPIEVLLVSVAAYTLHTRLKGV